MTPGSSPRTIRWGKFEPTLDMKALVSKVNREDLWREAAKIALGRGGGHSRLHLARQGDLFDGKVFDPADPQAYLKTLTIQARRSLTSHPPGEPTHDRHRLEGPASGPAPRQRARGRITPVRPRFASRLVAAGAGVR